MLAVIWLQLSTSAEGKSHKLITSISATAESMAGAESAGLRDGTL